MKLFRSKSIIVLLALAMLLMFVSTAAALPGVNSDVKTGFYVHDASKAAGQQYSYYSMPYVLDSAHFTAFLTYKNGFADKSEFIWVNSSEQFVSIANWNSGPADVTNIVTDLGSATYYDVEKATPFNLVLGVKTSVSSPAKTGFSLALSRAVAGLASGVTIKDSSNVVVAGAAVSNPTGDNKNFVVTCSLTPGETYTLSLDKTGFDFGGTISIDVPTETITLAATPVTNQGKTGFTLNLSSPLAGIVAAGNFDLRDQYGNQISITSATSEDAGKTYVFATANMIRERSYTLSTISDRYALSAPVTFIVAPIQVTATIEQVTVNDLVVKLSPGVDNIPSANFYLRDSSNQRLLSMILSSTGNPATEYKIGAFPYLNAGAQYSIEISMPEYNFGGAQSVSPGQTPVTMSVNGTPTTTGFAVTMSPALPGLTAANFSLKNSQNASVPFAVSIADAGATYNVKADIIAGSAYTISAAKNGYSFGAAKNVLAPVVMVGGGAVNGSVYVYLNGVLATVPAAGNFTITRQIGGAAQPNVTATAVSQNTTTRMLTLAVPQISATGADQTVSGTVTYGTLEDGYITKNYSFIVPSSPVYVAGTITSINAPAQDATSLTIPTVPAGFTIAIKSSSNPAVIATNGTITPPASTVTVNLVLTVTKNPAVTGTPTTADTISIAVVVPGSPTVVANGITSITAPAAGVTTLTLPAVPAEYTVKITNSNKAGVIDIDRTITPPFVQTNVVLILEVTKTANGSKKLTGEITVAVPQAPAITAINAASTGAQMQTALTNAGAFLTLANFGNLSSADKLTAANAVLSNRPAGGYVTQATLQAALDNAVANVQDYNDVAAAKTALAIAYATGDSATGVTQNVTLATTGTNGVTVSWTSDKTAIAVSGTTGTVTRPSYTDGNTTVIMTAKLIKGAAVATKTFPVVVTKLPQTAAEAVTQLNAATTVATMQTAITNPQLGLALTGYNALSTADKSTVANTILTGKPYTNQAAVQAALDTAVSNIANLNAVAAAKTALTITYATGDSAAGVTQNVTLATTQSGVTVSWASDKSNITTAGAVTRPTFTAGNVTVVLTATLTKGAATDTKTFNVVVTKAAPSKDASLSALTLSGVSLNPSFASGTINYTASAANNISSTTVSATATNAGATINAADLGSKNLVVGENTITVHITAEDGTTTAAYTVIVNRSDLLSVAFSAVGDNPMPPASVPGGNQVTILITDKIAQAAAGLNTTSAELLAGTARLAIYADNAERVFQVNNDILGDDSGIQGLVLSWVSSAISTVEQINALQIYKIASNDASLKTLTLSGITLSPSFASDTINYTASAANNISSTTVSATATNAGATINAADLGSKDLVVGENTITVHVTAEDGTTKATYTIIVTRGASAAFSVVGDAPMPPATVPGGNQVTILITDKIAQVAAALNTTSAELLAGTAKLAIYADNAEKVFQVNNDILGDDSGIQGLVLSWVSSTISTVEQINALQIYLK